MQNLVGEGAVLTVFLGRRSWRCPRPTRREAWLTKLDRHQLHVWRVKLGWTGGPYGQRSKSSHTSHAERRPELALHSAEFETDSVLRIRGAPRRPTQPLPARETWGGRPGPRPAGAQPCEDPRQHRPAHGRRSRAGVAARPRTRRGHQLAARPPQRRVRRRSQLPPGCGIRRSAGPASRWHRHQVQTQSSCISARTVGLRVRRHRTHR